MKEEEDDGFSVYMDLDGEIRAENGIGLFDRLEA